MSLRLSTGQKGVLWAGVLLCVWRLLENETVIEAVLQFLFAGIVPGTELKLSPDTILLALPAVFLLIVLLIFHKEWSRLARRIMTPRRLRSVALPQSVPAAATAPLVTHVQPVTRAVKQKPTSTLRPRIRSAITMLRTRAHRVRTWLAPRAHALGWHAGFYGARLVAYAAVAGRIVKRLACVLSRWLMLALSLCLKYSVFYWRKTAPYLWRFDHWLGVQVQAGLSSSAAREAKLALREIKKTLIFLWQKAMQLDMPHNKHK